MKPIENVLRNANEDNVGKSIPVIQAQIDYFRANNVDIQGISLITVLDLLDNKYSHESLRKDGYLLTLEDFQNDAQKYLKLAQENPILYNAQLKRLYRSYAVFKDKYTKGLVFNHHTIKEMTQKFTETLLAAYAALNSAVSGLPQSLSEKISKLLDIEAGKFNDAWFTGGDNEAIREYSEVLARKLLKLWDGGSLPESVAKQLTLEKEQINDVNALLSSFRTKDLPEDAMVKITSQVVGEITADMQAGKLTVHSALGALIAKRRDGTFQVGEYNFIAPVLKDWQAGKVSVEVAAELHKYIHSVIEGLRQDLIDSLSEKFSQLTVKNFIVRLRKNSYDPAITNDMKKLTADFAKDVLLVQGMTKRDELKECVKLVNSKAMSVLHDDWIQGRFTNDENAFVTHQVFDSLDEIAGKIQMHIWVNQACSDNAGLQVELAKERRERSDLAKQVQQLTALVTQLSERVAKMPASEVVAKEPAAKEPAVEEKSNGVKSYFFK